MGAPSGHGLYGYLTDPELVLFHGSRGGIAGDIGPRSRPGADFGPSFYMCDQVLLSKALVAHDFAPYSYTVHVDFPGAGDGGVLLLDDCVDWACAVLCNWRACGALDGTWLAERAAAMLEGRDFVAGPVADGRMAGAVRLFSENALTDEGLAACLAEVSHGIQVVAKTEGACGRIRVISEQPMYEAEADALIEYRRQKMAAAKARCREIQLAYQNVGRYLSEILADGPSRLGPPGA